MPTTNFFGWMVDGIRRTFPSMIWIIESKRSPRKSLYAESSNENWLITTEYTESRINKNVAKC